MDKKSVLHVIDAKYDGESDLTFDEMFDNSKFDTLYAITYSSTFDIVYNLAKKFNHLEIIFGCSKVLNGTISSVLAAQEYSVTLMKQNKHFEELLEMIKSGRLTLYLLKGRISHEKLYCLSGDNGATRIITGSANMTTPALRGLQDEGIIRFEDDQKAYDAFLKDFLQAKNNSVTKLEIDNLNTTILSETSAQETPVFAVIEKEKEIYIPVPVSEMPDDYDFINNVKDIEIDNTVVFDEFIKTPNTIDGKRKYRSDALHSALMSIALREEDNEKKKKEYIRFEVDKENGNVKFNDANFNEFVREKYSKKSTYTDLSCIRDYMDTFSKFHGDTEGMKDVVWKLICYAFASPYICELRRISYKTGYTYTPFPMYALICGESDSSKTVMTRVVSRLMTGVDPTSFDSETFTSTILLKGLKSHQVGIPIYINDLTKDQWSSHSGKILKNDNFEYKNPKYDCPVTIMTTNNVKTLKPEESKRCILLRTTAFLEKSTSLAESKRISDLLDSLSPNLYLEYLKWMTPEIKKMKERMLTGDSDFIPDIVNLSSKVLCEICKAEFGTTFDFMRLLNINEDYLGDNGVGKTKVKELIDYFYAQPEMFTFKKNGHVVVKFEQCYQADRYKNELPRSLCQNISGQTIICDEIQLKKIGIKKPILKRRI